MICKYSLIALLLSAGSLVAQQNEKINSFVKDSVYRYQGVNPLMNFNDVSFDLFVPFDFSLSNSNQLAEGDSSTLWLRTELALSSFTNYNSPSSKSINHMLLPYYNQYLENSKFNPISYVLGIAQTAAVGYMAYRHIKKYGFFK